MADVRRGGSFSLGLLFGGLIGTALTLLLAPQRGEETRRRARSRAGPLAERAKDTVTRLARRGEDPIEEEATESDVEVNKESKRRWRSEPKGEAAREASVPEEAGDGG